VRLTMRGCLIFPVSQRRNSVIPCATCSNTSGNSTLCSFLSIVGSPLMPDLHVCALVDAICTTPASSETNLQRLTITARRVRWSSTRCCASSRAVAHRTVHELRRQSHAPRSAGAHGAHVCSSDEFSASTQIGRDRNGRSVATIFALRPCARSYLKRREARCCV